MLNQDNNSATVANQQQNQLSAFRNNHENTMNPYTNASVGMLLLRLADTYLPRTFGVTEQDGVNANETYIDESIVALKKKLTSLKDYFKTAEDEFNAVMAYIDNLIAQEVNELDDVTVFRHGKTETYRMSLKVVFALVFRALTDKQVFIGEVEKTFPEFSPEQKQAKLAENEKDYLLTFYKTLNKLRQGKADGTNFCHTGVRNDIACSLNYVYPKVRMIEQVDAAISMALQDFVLSQLKEKSPAEQFKLLFHKLSENFLPNEATSFEAFVSDNQFTKEAKEFLEQFCLDNGLNPHDAEPETSNTNNKEPKTISVMIEENLSNLSYIPAPLGIHSHALHLQALIDFAYTETTLPEAANTQLQSELNSLTCFEDIENNGLLYRLKAIYLWQSVKKYQNIPFVGEEEAGFATAVTALLDFLPRYFQQSNQYAHAIESDAIKQHIAVIEAQEKKEPNRGFVENFFELWFNAEPVEQKRLRQRLLAEKSKLLLRDIDIATFFALRTEGRITHIEPYLINRFLMHAMLSPVEEWTDKFHEYFAQVMAFIQNDFKENSSQVTTTPSLNETSLRRDSYPSAYIVWFVALEKLHSKKNQGANFNAAAVVIQDCLVNGTRLGLTLKAQHWQAILEALDKDITQVIPDGDHLASVLKWLDTGARSDLIIALGYDFMKDIIQNGNQLVSVLFYLRKRVCIVLIATLGNKVKDIIQSYSQLMGVFAGLDRNARAALVSTLDHQLKDIIQGCDQLIYLLEYLDHSGRLMLITALGNKAKDIIQSYSQLVRVLEKLDQAARSALMTILGDKAKDIIEHGDQLVRVLEELDQADRSALMAILGDKAKDILKNGHQLVKVLRVLDQAAGSVLMATLGDKAKDIIKDGNELAGVLKYLGQAAGSVLMATLGNKAKDIIQNTSQLVWVLKHLDQSARFVLMVTLGDKAKDILKYCDQRQLVQVLENLDQAAGSVLMASLGDMATYFFVNGYSLVGVLRHLDKAACSALMTILGDDAKYIFADGNELAGVLRYLDQAARTALMFILGDKLKNIIRNGEQFNHVWNLLQQSEHEPHEQLKFLILLDNKELVREIDSTNEATLIYSANCRFTEGKKPFEACKAILQNYIEPEKGASFFRPWVKENAYVTTVREVLDDKSITSIDGFLKKISESLDFAEIKTKDESLYMKFQYVCALDNKRLENYKIHQNSSANLDFVSLSNLSPCT